MQNIPLVLASSSPYRKGLLENLGLEFSTCSPNIDESSLTQESPLSLSKRLATEKARAVAKEHSNKLIIGSDQTAELHGQLVGKPSDHANAVAHLRRASGQKMHLYTSIALLNTKNGNLQTHTDTVTVQYRSLTNDQIESYLQYDQPYDCCGSLKVESRGIALLSSIQSNDPNSIIGLPVIALISMLHNEGMTI